MLEAFIFYHKNKKIPETQPSIYKEVIPHKEIGINTTNNTIKMKKIKLITLLTLSLTFFRPTIQYAQGSGKGIMITGGLVAVYGGIALSQKLKKNKEKKRNSIKDKKLTKVSLLCEDKTLKNIQAGQVYKIKINAIDDKGAIYQTSRNGNTPATDWDIKVEGAKLDDKFNLTIPSEIEKPVIIKLTSTFDSNVKYTISLNKITVTKLAIAIIKDDSKRKSILIPGGYMYIQVQPTFDNGEKGDLMTLTEANKQFDIAIEGGSYNKYGYVQIATLPFGKNGNEKVKMSFKTKKGVEVGIFETALNYEGIANYYYSGHNGQSGRNAGKNWDGPGASGGMGGNGANANPISVLIDVFTLSTGKKLIIAEISDVNGVKKYFLGDPVLSELHIYNNGGNGGYGGDGGGGGSERSSSSISYDNIGYTGGQGGQGGNGGSGGAIKVTMSPAAKALNPKLYFNNKGGSGGSGGSGGWGGSYSQYVSESSSKSMRAPNGSRGISGYSGHEGPTVRPQIGKVNISIPSK